MFGEPSHGAAHLGDDTVEPGGRRQGVFDDREIDPERKQGLGEEGEILLNQIVDLPWIKASVGAFGSAAKKRSSRSRGVSP